MENIHLLENSEKIKKTLKKSQLQYFWSHRILLGAIWMKRNHSAPKTDQLPQTLHEKKWNRKSSAGRNKPKETSFLWPFSKLTNLPSVAETTIKATQAKIKNAILIRFCLSLCWRRNALSYHWVKPFILWAFGLSQFFRTENVLKLEVLDRSIVTNVTVQLYKSVCKSGSLFHLPTLHDWFTYFWMV